MLVSGTMLSVAFYVYLEAGSAYKPVDGAMLIAFQVVFYAMVVVAVVAAALGAAVLAGALKAPRLASVVFALFLTGIVALPFLGIASISNECALGTGFPFGASCG